MSTLQRTVWVLVVTVAFFAGGVIEAAKVALLVGVDRYQKPSFSQLRFAEADVKEVKTELAKLGFDVTLLLGPKATRAGISGTVKRLVDGMGTEDLMLVMLAGHGQQLTERDDSGRVVEVPYFCPYDGVAGSANDLYSLVELIDHQLVPNVGRNLILIDACRDAPQDVGRGIQGRVIGLPEDTAVLFSCRAGQQSYENSDLRHGVFTHALLEALRGGAGRDGKIVWSQVLSYVDWAMASAELRKYMPGPPQVPITAGGVPYTVLGEVTKSRPQNPPLPLPQNRIKNDFFNSIGMKITLVPGGEFRMGSPPAEAGRNIDEFAHAVRIARPFYMGVYEVTQAEYELVMRSNPSYFRRHGDGAERLEGQLLTDQLPVEQVSWQDANKFCVELSNLPAEVAAKRRYRLPTEAEWEYACRSGTETPFHFGNEFDSKKANADGHFAYGGSREAVFLRKTVDVAMFRPNEFGLYNLHGNVSEWCQDWYAEEYFLTSPRDNPVGPVSGSLRVLRGGSWFDNPIFARSAARQAADPIAYRMPFNGFRVVCEKR